MTGNVIDQFVVEFGLDPSKFTKGQKELTDQLKKLEDTALASAKKLEGDGKRAGEFFSGIKKEALSLFAVLVGAGGIEQFVAKTTTGFAALGRTSRLIGVAASDLQAFKMVIDRTGASGEQAVASLTNLGQALEVWKTYGQIDKTLLTGLNTIGANQSDNAIEVYQKFANWAKGRDARYVNQEGRMLGLDQGSIAEALKGGAQFRREMGESYKIGALPGPGEIDNLTKLVGAFQKLRQAISGDANELLYGFAPAMTQALTVADRFAEANSKLVKALLAVGTALTGWGALRSIAGVLKFLGIKGPAAAMAGAEGVVGTAARVVGGPLAVAATLFAPTQLASKEDDESPFLNPHARKAPGYHGPGSETVAQAAKRYGISADVLDAVWWRESGRGRNLGPSRAGALGHFQFLPGTAAAYGVSDTRDLAQSAMGAAHMIRDLVAHYGGDLAKALAAYNWGAGKVDTDVARHGADWFRHLPLETQRYISAIGGHLQPGANSVSIGSITINTRATDARGIASDIAHRTKQAFQANTGLSG